MVTDAETVESMYLRQMAELRGFLLYLLTGNTGHGKLPLRRRSREPARVLAGELRSSRLRQR